MKIAQHYEEKCQQLIHRSVTIHSFQLKSTLKIPEERKKHFEKVHYRKYGYIIVQYIILY